MIIGGSGSGKTKALLNSINNQRNIDKIYLYAKDPYEAKYQYLVNQHEKVGLNIMMILKLLLNAQMTCKMFIKLLNNTTLERNVKYQYFWIT